ncbi:sporulation protein YhbH [Clostridium sp. JN-9]|uniref:sporulation protein YhbH n=1 Tax=Clostridium sp. JN-9 TaxID=2507159 RepID=UPI000FFE0DF9|nr:sporulation protein YhbH [Clostridium sp. JN-9]QAT40087.1 sporulation protein YhbH [Clostridium sp. JN-9]
MAVFREFNPINHDRTAEDKRRHRQLVEDSIKKNIVDILSEESIIGQTKDKKIKIPIRGLKEYEFVYGKNKTGVGSGSGDEKRGDIYNIGNDGSSEKGNNGAGNEEGEDIYETEITIEEIFEYFFDDLNLPNLNKKNFSDIISEGSKKKMGFKNKGIRPRLAKKRTVIEKLKRKQGYKRALREDGLKENIYGYSVEKGKIIERFPFKEEDLKYYKIKPKVRKEYNAVIFCIMDTSASMDQNKKYLARSFFFMLCQFVKMKYNNVEVVFIAHSTVAKTVSENEFFHKVESGGTYISSGYNKAIEIINEKYNPHIWNIYSFHVSDGDNWSENNDKAVNAAIELCKLCNLFGYAEIMTYGYTSTIKKRYIDEIKMDNFVPVTMQKKEDMWSALREMLRNEIKSSYN